MQNFMSYSDKEKVQLCEVIKMEDVKLPRQHVFFGLRNVQNVGSGREENYRYQYHPYFISEGGHLKDAFAVLSGVAFACEDSKRCDVRNDCEVFPGYPDLLYVSNEKKGADDKVSRKTAAVDRTEGGDGNSSMDVCPDY